MLITWNACVCSFAYKFLVAHPLNEPPAPQQMIAKKSVISTALDKYAPVCAAVYGSHIVPWLTVTFLYLPCFCIYRTRV